MKTISVVFFILFVSFACLAQGEQVQVGCDCLHNAGTVNPTEGTAEDRKYTADRQCADRLSNIPGEEDTGLLVEEVSDLDNTFRCFAMHYVFGFGADERSAKQNAQQTCSLLVRDNKIVSANIDEEECKIL